MTNDAEVNVPQGSSLLKLTVPALAKMVRLLRYIAGDPALADRATQLIAPQTVTDAVVANLGDSALDESQEWAIAIIQFTAASGVGYYDPTGSNPTATGTRGTQLPSGGGRMEIRGAWNIRQFRIIAATGATVVMQVTLYKSSVWSTGALAEKGA